VCGIALGIAVFGDPLHISVGMIALQAGGFVALVLGVILVARAPALAALLKTHIPLQGQPGDMEGEPEGLRDNQRP